MEQTAKKLGFGLMRLPLTDVELLKTMVDAFLEKGFGCPQRLPIIRHLKDVAARFE